MITVRTPTLATKEDLAPILERIKARTEAERTPRTNLATPIVAILREIPITLGDDSRSDRSFRETLHQDDFRTGEVVDQILVNRGFQTSCEYVSVRVVIVAAEALGFESNYSLEELFERGRQYGLLPLISEAAVKIRLDYRLQPKGERVFIAMNPVRVYGTERILCVENIEGSGRYLSAANAGSSDRWEPGSLWAFYHRI